MGFEVDFLAVGTESKSGDAIALRYGNLHGGRHEQIVVVIDGGTRESGAQLVEHIRTYYRTQRVDFVVSTHPDGDHACGLAEVLTNLEVGTLLMHKPWEHAEDIRTLFASGNLTVRGLTSKIERALADAKELERIARARGIPIYEPFAGEVSTRDASLMVLGPSRQYYQSLVCDFRCAPEPRYAAWQLPSRAFSAAQELAVRVLESLQIETLDDSGTTSAENNSSVILLLRYNGESLLFTGDAGIPALTYAADYAAALGIDLRALRFLQVPHHGSRRNVGPRILDRIKAPTAYISAAAKGSPKHPSQRVINALVRRGSSVFSTKGVSLWHHQDAPLRSNYGPVAALPFVQEFDE